MAPEAWSPGEGGLPWHHPPEHERNEVVGPVLEAGNIICLERSASMLVRLLQEFRPGSLQSILAAGALEPA